jgi:hypothetical protein
MLREFTDKNGTAWRVWDVDPQSPKAPAIKDRRKAAAGQGWLVFDSRAERRRLTPIPAGWDSTDPEKLADLCEKAQVVPPLARNFEPRPPNS